eukprot:m.87257 g.87257  ORF g.87257 m.87257 type:complete len:59 (-) comp12236_c1_seq5:1733-1909(-)
MQRSPSRVSEEEQVEVPFVHDYGVEESANSFFQTLATMAMMATVTLCVSSMGKEEEEN